MLRRPPRDSVGSVGRARLPESRGYWQQADAIS